MVSLLLLLFNTTRTQYLRTPSTSGPLSSLLLLLFNTTRDTLRTP
jgi:hypothetical protein